MPDLENIEWQGRTAFIVFDSDATSNGRVRENESLLAAAIERRGADVKVVRLPGGTNGDKVGVDDFLVASGAAALRKLLDRAEAAEPPEPESVMQSAHQADPGDVAKKILAGCERDGLSRLRFWQGVVLVVGLGTIPRETRRRSQGRSRQPVLPRLVRG